MSDIKIYSFDKCPFAQRTRMAPIEKGLDFDEVKEAFKRSIIKTAKKGIRRYRC